MYLQRRALLNCLVSCLKSRLATWETRAAAVLGLHETSLAFDIAERNSTGETIKNDKSILDELFDSGFLWGVPVRRRTIEVRHRRMLHPSKVYKLKGNIITCPVCYHFHEAHTVCGNCYQKVKEETDAMQEAIQKELKWDPVDKEVAIVYQNGDRTHCEGKRIVEIEKPPPQWFSKNLLTRAYLPKEPNRDNQPPELSQPNVTTLEK